ncbi:MAG: hypothetical protein EBV06_14960 [Planctomycetia bacterium]|nr:hypothetical protein [Planctomycetia bacterium]
MAKGRIRSRMELREQHDAAEARERAETLDAGTSAVSESAEEVSTEGKPKKKKAAVKKAPSEAKPRKTKTKAVERKRLVWVVYDNSHKEIARFPYTQRKEADEKAEQLKTDKKQTYFVQPVKEVIKESAASSAK